MLLKKSVTTSVFGRFFTNLSGNGAAFAAALLTLQSCDSADPVEHPGARLIDVNGCGSCHEIPGIDWANGRVGPPLHHYKKQAYIAGILPNNKKNLVLWLMEPQSVHQHSAMPDVGLDQATATAIAEYLYE